jgi:hypothetical protein
MDSESTEVPQLLSLPPELLLHLRDASQWNTPDVLNLMYTCRALHDVFQPVLYSYLVVSRGSLTKTTFGERLGDGQFFLSRQYHYEGVEKLVKQLGTQPVLAALVKKVSIFFPTHDMHYKSSLAPLVTLSNATETFQAMQLPELLNCLELQVHIWSWRNYIQISDLLGFTSRLPRLQRLVLSELPDAREWRNDAPSPPSELLIPPTLKSLTIIKIWKPRVEANINHVWSLCSSWVEDLTLHGQCRPYTISLGNFSMLTKLRSLTLQDNGTAHLPETFACLHTFPLLEILRCPEHPELFGKRYPSLKQLWLAVDTGVKVNYGQGVYGFLGIEYLRKVLESSEFPMLEKLVLKGYEEIESLAEKAGIPAWCASKRIALRFEEVDDSVDLYTFEPLMEVDTVSRTLVRSCTETDVWPRQGS